MGFSPSSVAPHVNLVAGGAGFLGFSLVAALLKRGERVICVDDLSTGEEAHVHAFAENENYRFIRHDVTLPLNVAADRVFNLACPASPPAYQKDPIKTLLTNVLGARNLLDLAVGHKARFVQASTSEVYGDPKEHPQKESYRGNVNTIGPRACYDEGKRCAETLISDYVRTYDVDARIARIFNTYGPGMREDDGRVVSNFIVESLSGRALTIYGDGSNTRSLCYVDDLVRGLMLMMDTNGLSFEPINLGNDHEYSVASLARVILDLTGSSSPIVHLPDVHDDPQLRRPDTTHARESLGWRPRVELEEGLRRTIAYFAQRLGLEINLSVTGAVLGR